MGGRPKIYPMNCNSLLAWKVQITVFLPPAPAIVFCTKNKRHDFTVDTLGFQPSKFPPLTVPNTENQRLLHLTQSKRTIIWTIHLHDFGFKRNTLHVFSPRNATLSMGGFHVICIPYLWLGWPYTKNCKILQVASLKLTYSRAWKWMVEIRSFPFGMAYLQG